MARPHRAFARAVTSCTIAAGLLGTVVLPAAAADAGRDGRSGGQHKRLHALLHPAVSAHAEPALRRSMSQLRRSAHGHLPLGARIAVVWAFHELGRPYVYGAAGPNAFDCSGLARFVWGKAGRSLAHYTGAQVHEGHRIGRRSARPGDLVFFGSDVHHVGVYVGDGYMIDAPHSGANVHRARVSWGSVVAIVRP